MELNRVGSKIKSAGKNKQCTIHAKDITMETMSKKRVEIFMCFIIANILLKCNNILLKTYSYIYRGLYENFFIIYYFI